MILADEEWVLAWMRRRFQGGYFQMSAESRDRYLKQCAEEIAHTVQDFKKWLKEHPEELSKY